MTTPHRTSTTAVYSFNEEEQAVKLFRPRCQDCPGWVPGDLPRVAASRLLRDHVAGVEVMTAAPRVDGVRVIEVRGFTPHTQRCLDRGTITTITELTGSTPADLPPGHPLGECRCGSHDDDNDAARAAYAADQEAERR